MDLTGRLLRFAAGRTRPFVVTAPGGTAARLAVEGVVRERGWASAGSPADADLLVVCGAPGRDLAAAVERVWRQMPGPRARVQVSTGSAAAELIERARRRVADPAAARTDAAHRTAGGSAQPLGRASGTPPGHDMAGTVAGTVAGHMDSRETDGHDMGGHPTGGHGHHDMSGMEIAGLPMADRAPDRDGLRLDVLHVPLGPALPDWPAGLVLRLTVQGDVVQQADVEVLDAATAGGMAAGAAAGWHDLPFWVEPWLRAAHGEPVMRAVAARRRAAAHLDSFGRLLAVAGWPDAMVTARWLRDDLLAGATPVGATRFLRRVGRSRVLRWMSDGLGVVDAEVARARGVPGAAGDVTARWRRWIEETAAALSELNSDEPLAGVEREHGPRGAVGDGDAAPSLVLLDLLPALVVGTELAATRLIVASLDPDLDELVGSRLAAAHG